VGPWSIPHWQELNYAIEIYRARACGVDGFGVDVLALSGPLWERIRTLLAVTDAVAPEFRVILEPDMNAMRGSDAEKLADALHELAASASVYRLDNRVVVAPYNAELRTPDFWAELLTALKRRDTEAVLLPIFLNERLYERDHPEFAMPYANWTHPDLNSLVQSYSAKHGYDRRRPIIMDGISAQHTAPKSASFREAANTTLFRTGWQWAIQENVPSVQLVSWNDYTEGTQIAPSLGTQFVFYDLCLYHSLWFQVGSPPSVVRDALYYSHRMQIILPDSKPMSDETAMHVIGSTPIKNEIEMLAFLTAPATLQIEIAGRTYEQRGVPGITSCRAPAAPGRPIFRIVRAGRTILEKASDWTIVAEFNSENPEYVGGSSTRQFVRGL
jgi:hypothetical protein